MRSIEDIDWDIEATQLVLQRITLDLNRFMNERDEAVKTIRRDNYLAHETSKN